MKAEQKAIKAALAELEAAKKKLLKLADRIGEKAFVKRNPFKPGTRISIVFRHGAGRYRPLKDILKGAADDPEFKAACRAANGGKAMPLGHLPRKGDRGSGRLQRAWWQHTMISAEHPTNKGRADCVFPKYEARKGYDRRVKYVALSLLKTHTGKRTPSPGTTIRRGQKMRASTDWKSVDWSMNDAELARRYGCTREAVRQKRRIIGIGRSPRWHRRSGSADEKIAVLDTSGMTLKQIASAAGCSVSYALQCVARMKKGYKPEIRRGNPKYDWTKVDWRKTDAEVAEALGIKNKGVVSQYRFRHNIWKKGAKANVGVLMRYPSASAK